MRERLGAGCSGGEDIELFGDCRTGIVGIPPLALAHHVDHLDAGQDDGGARLRLEAEHESDPALDAPVIRALAQRIQKPQPVSQAEFDAWDDAYADAMRKVNSDFPGDQDVMALFVEAMMTRNPWDLWDVKKACPTEGADTLEAIGLCEQASCGL